VEAVLTLVPNQVVVAQHDVGGHVVEARVPHVVLTQVERHPVRRDGNEGAKVAVAENRRLVQVRHRSIDAKRVLRGGGESQWFIWGCVRHHSIPISRVRCIVPQYDGTRPLAINKQELWGQLLHGCATTTETVRRAIQQSQASVRCRNSSRHNRL
jgi:hypothetical protein